MKNGINLTSFLIVILIHCLLAAEIAAAEDSKEVLCSGSPVLSKALGVETIAANVLFHSVKNPGLYINSAPAPGSLAKRMGLKQGNVLLTLDGFSANTAEAVDRWMSRRPEKPLQFTYSVVQNGHPKLYEKRLSHPPKAEAFEAHAASTVGSMHGNESSSTPSASLTPYDLATTPSGSGNYSTEELEAYDLTLINQARRSEGSPEVQSDHALAKLARDYADYMMQHPDRYVNPQFTPHVDLQGRIPQMRASDAGINREVHENLNLKSRGRYDDKILVQQAHERMMAEPAGQHNHRSIMLDPGAKAVGIGIARKGTLLYLVEEFGH